MGQDQELNPRLYEDESFEYAGYAKVTPELVTIGDGVRWPNGDGCWLVVDVVVDETFGLADFTLADRASHVSSVLGRAGILPVDELAESLVEATFSRVVGLDDVLWVRL